MTLRAQLINLRLFSYRRSLVETSHVVCLLIAKVSLSKERFRFHHGRFHHGIICGDLTKLEPTR